MSNDVNGTPSKKSPDMADLAPFVAAVLKDRVVHDLVEENEKLKEECEKQLSVYVSAYIHRSARFRTNPHESMRNAYLVQDRESLYLCIDVNLGIPDHFTSNTIITVCLGGVMVYGSIWEDIARHDYLDHHLVKKFIWIEEDEKRSEAGCAWQHLVAVLFNINMLPGIMDALGPDVLCNVHDLKSCFWLLADSNGSSDTKIKVDQNGNAARVDAEGNVIQIIAHGYN